MGPAPPGGWRGPAGPNPPGRFSGRKFNLKSKRPLSSVLSMIGRPACCCSTPIRLVIGAPDAATVKPDVGFIIIIIAPRGTEEKLKAAPGWPGGGGGGSAGGGTAGAGPHGNGGPPARKGGGVWSSDFFIFGP